MNMYPAIKAKIGSWIYYAVKMTARELAESVNFAYEIYEDRTLDEATQRTINAGRVKTQIVQYLKRQPNRFFSSLVVAALEGDPRFYPVQITDDPQFSIFRDDKRLNDTFGVLVFDGRQKYYALDGQHRLSSIKTLVDKKNPLSDGAPEGFEDEEFTVLVVVPSNDDTPESFLQKYRRLFGNLNRYAKPTDQATNIIMDEDDVIAILTRRLISEHPYFMSSGPQKQSIRIKCDPGKNLKTGDSFITTIEILYEINMILLSSRSRSNKGWGNGTEENESFDSFKRFRPSDEYMDSLYEELKLYWNCILKEIPDLKNDPSKMRTHGVDDGGEEKDHLLFWPIGQQMLAQIVRQILDRRLTDPDNPTEASVEAALRGLGALAWQMNQVPWRYFLLINENRKWKIRNEERKEIARLGQLIQLWLLGVDNLDEMGITNLYELWSSKLIPQPTQEEKTQMWEEITGIRSTVETIRNAP